MQWFGKSWGAPICDPQDHAETPVGQLCSWCTETIEANDAGVIIPHLEDRRTTMRPQHYECFIRQVAGSVAHQLHRCSCYGGKQCDPTRMTKRKAAKAATICHHLLSEYR